MSDQSQSQGNYWPTYSLCHGRVSQLISPKNVVGARTALEKWARCSELLKGGLGLQGDQVSMKVPQEYWIPLDDESVKS